MSLTAAETIDQILEQASAALVATDYVRAEALALRGLSKALGVRDFERAARITLPLQEARRQRRHEATDAGQVFLLGELPKPASLVAGMYLLRPPLIGVQAAALRQAADRKGVPVFVLVREPTTKDGLWPIVGATTQVSVRVRLKPPASSMGGESGDAAPDAAWMLAAGEALGDEAIRRLKPDDPAAWKVADLVEFLDAVPEHEKLHQRLADECRRAMREPPPSGKRRRPIVVDDWF
ncbi:MAG: hypothetical protein SFZ23_10145 [Planctomycetota bacterium]|nr:hypothetical protein [Planctomycetota bacterium]